MVEKPQRLFDSVYKNHERNMFPTHSDFCLVIHFMEREMGFNADDVMERLRQMDTDHTAVTIIVLLTGGLKALPRYTDEQVQQAIRLFSDASLTLFQELFGKEAYQEFSEIKGTVTQEDLEVALTEAMRRDFNRAQASQS